MIELVFEGISSLGDRTIGPAQAFRIAGNFVRAEPTGTIVARYEGYHWPCRRARTGRCSS